MEIIYQLLEWQLLLFFTTAYSIWYNNYYNHNNIEYSKNSQLGVYIFMSDYWLDRRSLNI